MFQILESKTVNRAMCCPYTHRHAQAQQRPRYLTLAMHYSAAGDVVVPHTADFLQAGTMLSRYIAVVSMKLCSFPDYVMLT